MSEEFKNKDYEEYFLALEQSINSPKKVKTVEENVNIITTTNRIKKAKKRKRKIILNGFIAFICVVALVCVVSFSIGAGSKDEKLVTDKNISNINKSKDDSKPKIVYPFETQNTFAIGGEIDSQFVVVVDAKSDEIIALKNPYQRTYPASTTKIMTLLVAVENITDLSDTFTMTYEITDPMYEEGATVAGFSSGEVINLKDMLYGIILPSGGDASIGVATKISGSEEAFVALMNQKAEDLGLKDTHFTNCTGLYDSNHYTTAADLAVILKEAMKNPLCKEILSTYQYTATPTDKHPEGLKFSSTLFNYMRGDESEGAEIKGGKTGFVNESGYCIASFGQSDEGKEYIVVTLKASSRWPAFYDQIDLFSLYAGKSDVKIKR